MKFNSSYVLPLLTLLHTARVGKPFRPPLQPCHQRQALDIPFLTKRIQTPSSAEIPVGSPLYSAIEHRETPKKAILTVATIVSSSLVTLPLPAEATSSLLVAGPILSALFSYAHILSILGILGCLVAERFLVSTDMSAEDEDAIVNIDVLYGVLAMLLIGSGFARATTFEKGGDFYIHESTFWIKMIVSGIWGGLSLFPSLTFYKRKDLRASLPMLATCSQDQEPIASTHVPISGVLVARLHSIINMEITAILTIPLLASFMSRGVGYSSDFPWQAGVVASLMATGGSFFYYARQALTWDDHAILLARVVERNLEGEKKE